MAATQEKSLSQFPTAAQILLTTLVFGSVVDATSTSGYDSVKILVSDLAEAILGDFAYTQDLATDTKTIFGAINSIRVLSGTATPNNADGANGQIYVKYASADYSVVALYVKLNDAWREISTGGGGGGASVQMGTTTPTAASGSDGDLYVQYDGTTYEVVAMFVKINGAWREIPLGGEVVITPIAVTSQMVTASSTVGSNFEGYRAFDGQSCNISTMQGGWLANANDNTPTLTVDFGTAQSLGRIAIETANNNNPDTTRAVYIEGSNDATTWENILASDTTASLSFINGSYSEYTFELNDGNYRYFRIRGTQPFFGGSFQYSCCFSEVIIYDKASGIPAIADLTDVDISSPTDGQLLRYNGTSGKWENAGIINDTTASTSSVYSSNKTDYLLSAKANTSDIPTKTSELTNNSGFITASQAPMQRIFNGWTTSLTTNFERIQFIVMISDITIYLVWIAGAGNDITVRNIANNTIQTSNNGSVTIDSITFRRTNAGSSTISVITTTNRTITIIG